MKVILLILILISGLLIIKNKGYNRFKYFLLSIIFLPGSIPLPSPGLGCHRFLILTFFISLVVHQEIKKLKMMPCIIWLILLGISYFGTGLHDTRLLFSTQIWRSFIYFCIEYGVLILGFSTNIDEEEWYKFRNLVFKIALIVGVYGIITFVIRTDPWGDLLAHQFNLNEGTHDFIISGLRSRVTSFLLNSHLYGFFSAILCILFSFWLYKTGLSNKEKMIFLITFIGVLLSGSRSSLMTAAIGIGVLSVLGLKLKKFSNYVLIAFLLFIPFSQTDVFQEKTQSLSDIFQEGGGKTGGSSVSMRENQLELSLLLFAQSPIWGNGFDYFSETVGNDDYFLKNGIYGAESYYFILLIERGGIEMVAALLFAIGLMSYFLRKRNKYKLEYSFAISLFVAYIAISFMTGNRAKWEYCFPLIGLLMNKNNILLISKQTKNEKD